MNIEKILEKKKDITHLSNYKTPAKAEYFFQVNCRHDVDKIFDIKTFCHTQGLPFLIIGGGTNILFDFDVYTWVIIKNNLRGWSYNTDSKILESKSQEKIRHIARILEEEDGQAIWHRFIGLPGSIGWAVYGNAGCFGLEIEGNFLSAQVLDLQSWDIQIFSKEEMEFSYRNSRLKKDPQRYFLISVTFDLSENREKYPSRVDNIYFREHQQPKGNSCGSFFKNPSINREDFIRRFPHLKKIVPDRLSAGFLIEQVWLKWYQIGGASFSDLHANFLIHNGQGTHQDLVKLLRLAQQRVQDAFGVELENEVQIITII